MLDNTLYRPGDEGLTRTRTLAGGFDICDYRYGDGGVAETSEPFTARKPRERRGK